MMRLLIEGRRLARGEFMRYLIITRAAVYFVCVCFVFGAATRVEAARPKGMRIRTDDQG